MTPDGETQIIQLLTEMRNAQTEEMAYRRRVLDESLGLQKKAMRIQRIALTVCFVTLIVGLGFIASGVWGGFFRK